MFHPTFQMGASSVEKNNEPYLNLVNLLLGVYTAASIKESHPTGTLLPWRRSRCKLFLTARRAANNLYRRVSAKVTRRYEW